MKNVQISFDKELLNTIDRFATASRRSRSAVVREAVKTRILQKEIKEFEDEWIKKLKEISVDPDDSEAWMSIEKWSDELDFFTVSSGNRTVRISQ
jgi:metal-responsive CopG/Arc/MetJ family transcriptional regulator